jgi:hypothetical protein
LVDGGGVSFTGMVFTDCRHAPSRGGVPGGGLGNAAVTASRRLEDATRQGTCPPTFPIAQTRANTRAPRRFAARDAIARLPAPHRSKNGVPRGAPTLVRTPTSGMRAQPVRAQEAHFALFSTFRSSALIFSGRFRERPRKGDGRFAHNSSRACVPSSAAGGRSSFFISRAPTFSLAAPRWAST